MSRKRTTEDFFCVNSIKPSRTTVTQERNETVSMSSGSMDIPTSSCSGALMSLDSEDESDRDTHHTGSSASNQMYKSCAVKKTLP